MSLLSWSPRPARGVILWHVDRWLWLLFLSLFLISADALHVPSSAWAWKLSSMRWNMAGVFFRGLLFMQNYHTGVTTESKQASFIL